VGATRLGRSPVLARVFAMRLRERLRYVLLRVAPARSSSWPYCTFPSSLRVVLRSGVLAVPNGPQTHTPQVSERKGVTWPVPILPRLHCQPPINRSHAAPAATAHAGYHCDGHSKCCAGMVATGSSSLAGQQRMTGFGGQFETSHVVSEQC
jgi:hypothetical protein